MKNQPIPTQAALRAHCSCSACRQTGPENAPWKARRRQRQQRTGAQCACSACTGREAERQGWPVHLPPVGQAIHHVSIVHIVNHEDQPTPALPLHRHFENRELHLHPSSRSKSVVRVVYVYQPRQAGRSRTWQASEQDVVRLYQKKFRNPDTVQAQSRFRKGRPVSSSIQGSTIPDVVLTDSGIRNVKDAYLPLKVEQLEIVEVKRYDVNNMPSMFSRLLRQLNSRKGIRVDGRPLGRFQSVILDFRGQEAACASIRAAVKRLVEKLETTHGMTILVQVLLWDQGKYNCRPR